MKIRRLQHWIKSSDLSSLVLYCFTVVGYFIFYTDWHTVDEDMLAILSQGAGWCSIDGAGITQRDIDDISNNVDNNVASV